MKFRTLTCTVAMTLFAALGLTGSARAQTFTSLYSFDAPDGGNPYAGLVQATNGDLYGTTFGGGANGYGTIFKISPSGTPTTLHSFDGTDGSLPYAGLVQATNGNFYGTTLSGGANGSGTIFKITPGGTLTTLHSFDGTDGSTSYAGLVQGADGSFYGTTLSGGTTTACDGDSCGTVFKITPNGTLTTLHTFDGTDGRGPGAALVEATNGAFYGTTVSGGGSSSCDNGCGTVFKITHSGTLTTLHTFDSADGARPEAPLIQATDGNLYGTTYYGGAYGAGTVFAISPSGTLTILYSFCSQSGCVDGYYPEAALVHATDGNFYGTTTFGGTDELSCVVFCGTVFKITPSGTLTTLHSFDGTDGEDPGTLLQDTNGMFYGTTAYGGANNSCEGGRGSCGTVFSLSVGLGPFVETLPTFGKVGAAVGILGSNLKGATSVTFNGTAATFKVSSASLITTTVPAGATTGPVEVTLPSGTLTSNVPFRVTK